MKFVQFGAGNIGRSFIGQLFSRAGWEVVFVDVDDALLHALNERRSYTVEIRDHVMESLICQNVRGVDGRDTAAVAEELATADCAGTAVGQGALRFIYPNIARGLTLRRERGCGPLNIIICENLRDAAEHFRAGLREHLPDGFPLDAMAGLVETSIGKMVPLVTEEMRAQDPLTVYAEAYNTLILDRKAFLGPVPDVAGLVPKDNMKAYVDRKLFVHNLGHAAVGYLGHLWAPEAETVCEAVADERVAQATRGAMWESARALIAEYPGEFSEESLGEHIEDLLQRFANEALGDTVYRIGRDVPRKLSAEDRLVGALKLDAKHHVLAPWTTQVAAAAMLFRATDEGGRMLAADEAFETQLAEDGPRCALESVSDLSADDPAEGRILNEILAEYDRLIADAGSERNA